jgi:hypothetical protein
VIFEPELETLPREGLRALQTERLRALIAYAKARVPLYAERLAGAEPGDFASVDDLRLLPFTRKDDLRDTYPFEMLAVPRERLARVHASSGTTGKLTVVGYTAADLELFARVNARSLAMAGAEPGMLLHNAYGYGLFTGGLGIHGGGERLGLSVVPVSGGMTERQLMLIEDLRPDVIACTPSYALTLAQAFHERGVTPEEISLRYAVLGAEPWTGEMRGEIDAGLGVRSTNIFGLSEVIGPGVSCECVEARAGCHVNEDHFLPEIVDPDTGEPLAEGEEGVLVFTTLTKEANPGRGRPAPAARAVAQLPHRRHAPRHARRGGGRDRGRRRGRRSPRAEGARRAASARDDRLQRLGDADGAGQRPPLGRREAPARPRSPLALGCARPQERQDGVDAAVLRRVRRQVELAEDRAHVGLDGLRRHVERLRDAAVGAPLGDQSEHLELARRQLREIGRGPLSVPGSQIARPIA